MKFLAYKLFFFYKATDTMDSAFIIYITVPIIPVTYIEIAILWYQ